MRLTLERTEQLYALEGVDCRVWTGADDEGTPLHCYVARVFEQENPRRLQLEPTHLVIEVDAVECRVWEGFDELGVPVSVYIARVAIHKDAMTPEVERRFASRLRETHPPRLEIRTISTRLVL